VCYRGKFLRKTIQILGILLVVGLSCTTSETDEIRPENNLHLVCNMVPGDIPSAILMIPKIETEPQNNVAYPSNGKISIKNLDGAYDDEITLLYDNESKSYIQPGRRDFFKTNNRYVIDTYVLDDENRVITCRKPVSIVGKTSVSNIKFLTDIYTDEKGRKALDLLVEMPQKLNTLKHFLQFDFELNTYFLDIVGQDTTKTANTIPYILDYKRSESNESDFHDLQNMRGLMLDTENLDIDNFTVTLNLPEDTIIEDNEIISSLTCNVKSISEEYFKYNLFISNLTNSTGPVIEYTNLKASSGEAHGAFSSSVNSSFTFYK